MIQFRHSSIFHFGINRGTKRSDRTPTVLYIILIYISLLLLASCARPITPTGGPKDSIPPRIIRTWPENGTLSFSGNQIIFQFSEYVESANLTKDIFITPIPSVPPEMLFRGKKLFIRWKEPLLPQTTYVIQPGKGLRDVNEKNPLDSLFQFAFSTGTWLDSLEIQGKVTQPLSGEGAPSVSILLFEADSALNDSIFKKRPAYASQTRDDGTFWIKYLRPGNYRIYGVREDNANFEYNSTKEGLALASDPAINPTDTAASGHLALLLSQPDLDKPKLRNKTWLTQYLLELEWNEPLQDFSGNLKPEIQVQDTLGEKEFPIYLLEGVASAPERMRVYFSEPVSDPVRVSLRSVCDTLQSCVDTSFVLQPRKQIARYPLRLTQQSSPVFSDTLTLLASEPLATGLPDTAFVAVDTARKRFPIPWKTEGRQIHLDLSKQRSNPIAWTIQTDSMTLAGYSGSRSDTVYQFTWNVPNKDDFGAINGTLVDSLGVPLVSPMMRIQHMESGKVWFQKGNRFDFPALRPGDLQIFWFEDTDGNGRWTPGSLHPYRLPERGYPIKGIPKIRAGWELENIKTDAIR